VHPGIGYDIIANHPCSTARPSGERPSGLQAVWRLGRGLDEAMVLSVGSAIMGPQVFEKGLSS